MAFLFNFYDREDDIPAGSYTDSIEEAFLVEIEAHIYYKELENDIEKIEFIDLRNLPDRPEIII